MIDYIIKTERLGLRNWLTSDLDSFHKMSQDKDVMQFFPKLLSKSDCINFITRMQDHFQENGYCYFAIDLLKTKEFIGFTGLLNQNYKSSFTPCVDIGWRLNKGFWANGYATEAANSCIEFAINSLELEDIYSIATTNNKNSISVMKKIGMNYHSTFQHPALIKHQHLKECVVYKKQLN